MSRNGTIRSSDEIGTIVRSGKRFSSPAVTVFIARTPEQRDPRGRVAFVAPKRLGHAVWRSRAKRLLRASYQLASLVHPGYDLLFMANRGISSSKPADIAKDMQKLLRKAGLLQ